MPASLTFPGVYIEEIPSGVRTIVGVPTSIAAFLGRTVSGPINTPVIINSFADFERFFGGMSVDLPLGYAVSDFYQNGGAQAVIVRLFRPKDPKNPGGAARFTVGGLTLEASSPGAWGSTLTASIDTDNISPQVLSQFGLEAGDLFNLTIKEVENGRVLSQERFLNLTVIMDDSKVTLPATRARRVDRVLNQSSQLVTVPLLPDPKDPKKAPKLSLPPKSPQAGSVFPLVAPAPTEAAPNPPTPSPATPLTAGDDGQPLTDDEFKGDPLLKTGINALDTVDLFNLLCIPADTFGGDTSNDVYNTAAAYCKTRRAMVIVDPPALWSANAATAANTAKQHFSVPAEGALSVTGEAARNAALYFPRLIETDPLRNGQTITVVPCGAVAGVMARTDVSRGVWKAPAGLDATISGIAGFDVNLTNDENGMLNPLGINCLRSFPVTGRVVWGARTMRGADQSADDYKYIPVRRLALFLEESLYRGTQWVVFEPNDTPLWSQIRLDIGAFLHTLFVQGAFQGSTPKDAYFVKCDSTTTTQNDINLGVVNIVVGFAPLKPAEFVVLQIQQIAGSIQV